jgi:4-amino-4-deoxy-L-arabinose transferase-like glycosyltransferase
MNFKIKKINPIFIVIFLALVFFVGTSSFNFYTQEYSSDGKADFVKWAAPDESANYIFTKLYAQTGELKIVENYNLYTSDIMHPRSLRSDYGDIKPVSFLGIILIFGSLAKLFSYKIIPFLTPLFASFGIIAFYFLVKKIFNKSNALLSSFLLASFPPYIYYTARSMFHNVLFTVLLIFALSFLVYALTNKKKKTKNLKASDAFRFFKHKKKQVSLFSSNKFINKHFDLKKINYLSYFFISLSGIFLGLSVITRSSELLWLLPLFLFLWIFNIRKIGFLKLIIFLMFVFISILPAGFYNKILYGSYFYGGYSEMNSSIIGMANAGIDFIKSVPQAKLNQAGEASQKIKNIVFHFGLHPRFSLKMAYEYFIKMFYWIFWPALFGFLIFLFQAKKYKKRHFIYLGGLIILSSILIIYYGSWEFHDNPDASRHTIGNSYTRYWLPIYLGAMPFASLFIMRLTRAIASLIFKLKSIEFFKNRKNKKFVFNSLRVIIVIFIFYISINFVLFGSEEGLIFLAEHQKNSKLEWEEIINLTEGNATIITRYHDKLLFPERKVIVGLFDDKNMVQEYANLVKLLPVYYYNFTFPEKDIEYLNEKRLYEAGLQIKEVKQITSDFTLYKLFLLLENEKPPENELAV